MTNPATSDTSAGTQRPPWLQAVHDAWASDKAPELPELLTTEEFAAVMRTSAATCRYWRHIGTGPKSFKVGRRVLYDRRDVLAWIAEAREQQCVA